ncbi:MAG: hypothetical protein DRQ02_04270 [Candidatus Latescibacterota bacterium]|nr:MAG: hypothetical protein DRQ02_04270 [Candidatus Latescibacterota bacterium]RKY73067.1 MAG: hypothetical protein DRQ24_03335 [Candidatus Latescibacterota bacterium]
MVSKFLIYVSLIYGFLLLGYLAKRRAGLGERVSSTIMKSTIVFLEPVIICSTFWILDLSDLSLLFAVPLTATMLSLSVVLPARFFSGLLGHDSESRGAFLGCAMFSNIGVTLGGFICFLFLGEPGFSVSLLYTAYFIPFLFTIGFLIVGRYSPCPLLGWRNNLEDLFTNPIRIVPMVALFLGLLLDFSGVERPQIVGTVSRNLIYLDVALYTFAIGMTIRVRKIAKYLRDDLSLSVLKFIVSPLIAVSIAYLLGCHRILGGLPLKVVFIESCMPVAIFSLVLSRLLDLNQDLANSAWIFTTFAVLPLTPLIYFVMNLL